MTLATDLLDHADTLLTLDPRRPRQVHLRRATSAAYYGLFHDLLAGATRQGVPHDAAAELKEVFGRTYGHALMKEGAKLLIRTLVDQSAREPGAKQEGQPMPKASRSAQRICGGRLHADLAAIGLAFTQLQEQRHRADYSTGATFTKQAVSRNIDAARVAVEGHRKLAPSNAAALYLLLRTRDLRLG